MRGALGFHNSRSRPLMLCVCRSREFDTSGVLAARADGSGTFRRDGWLGESGYRRAVDPRGGRARAVPSLASVGLPGVPLRAAQQRC